jgi:hypothetical protein
MATYPITRALQVALLLSASCVAQTAPPQSPNPAPCPPPNQTTAKIPDKTSDQTAQTAPTAKPCPPPAPAAKKPASTAEQFPFPGETSKPKSPPDSPSPSTPPDSPNLDSPRPTATTPSDAASQHPFPTQPPPKLPGDDSSSSSSSSSGADDPSANAGDPTAAGDPSNPPEGTSVHRKLPKVKRVQTDDERVDEDLSVAKFYLNDENYQGAYLRAKDAVNVQPEYSAAHFTLAEIAQKMKKKDEAIAEFQTYLKLDPEGEKAKAAKKALAELQ